MKYEVFYERNKGCYYKDEQGKIVSETYKYANPFDEYGIALIEDFNSDYYFINEKFEKISPPYYYTSEFFTVGNKRMAAMKYSPKSDWYFMDQNFEIISPACRSLMGTLYDSEDYNGGKLPFMTLRDFNYFLDLNFQKVSPKYFHVETPFYYFPTLDENCAEVEEWVDGKYLHYLINEDFVKITHGVEERPLNWAGYIEHIIPEKVKSNKTYSRILSGELITQANQTNEVQLENTPADAQSIVEMVKNGTLHSDNSTSTEENKTTSNSTSTIVTQSENIAPKEDTQPKKPTKPSENKKSVVEMVKEDSIHSDKHTNNGNGTTGNTSSIETQSLSPAETPRKETKKSVVETVKTRSNRSKDSVAEEKSPTSDCKYKKVKVGSKWVFKDENGKKASEEYDIIGDFDDNGITNVGNFPRRHGIDNPCFYYINTNLERVSRAYDSASKFYRVGDIDMAVAQDVSYFIINRDFERISDYYPRIWANQILKEDGTPFTQIKVLDRDKENSHGYCQYFLDNNLQRISPKYDDVSFFEYKFEGIDEYFALASVLVFEEHKYISFLINEDFEIVSSQIPFSYKGDDYSQFLIPEKVKSNKSYSKLMTGETPQDELLG